MIESPQTAESIGLAAKARRKALGLTLQQVADLAGVAITFVHELEHGKPTMRLSKVVDVLTVLGLELEVRDRSK